MRLQRSALQFDVLSALSVIAILLCSFSPALLAQTSISTGSIIGTITDPSGAAVPNAAITITNKDTGHVTSLVSNNTGTYHSGPLLPGNYAVQVRATGFSSVVIPVTVQVGVTASGNAALRVGSTSTVVQVQASNVVVNSVQPTIQGVLTRQQISELPINGRNFLALAGLQPGVQIQDGIGFDPTKVGFSSISFGSRYGRTARILVDGLDESDETVGTTTQNIPMSAIQEFQTEQSSLDITSGLTSSGAVNVTTRYGTNKVHGDAFYYGRWHNAAARIAPTDLFFRRQQEGGDVGGPFAKDKLFFFVDYEHTRQDLAQPIQLSPPFTSLSGSLNAPFKESQADGRLDWQIKPNVHAFYRYTYDINSSVKPFISNTFSPYLNYNHSQDHAVGLDITTGNFTHQVRFGFMRFANVITNAVTPGSGIYNPAPNLTLAFGSSPDCILAGADPFCSGPNILAPQATQQHDLETKYDGSVIYGSHIFRYGFGWNRILGGGFASFFGLAPSVNNLFTTDDKAAAAKGPFPGGASNPLNYTPDIIIFGNGQGFSTETPRFGFPAGGQYDNRIRAYFGDTWKIKPNFVLDYGVRYVRDTGRDDADLPPISILSEFGPGLNKSTHQPDLNFAPQLGFAWDPWKSGKTVIRAGAGLYYENAVFNNVLFDRPARLQKGLFLGTPVAVCAGTAPTSLSLPGGATFPLNICGQPIGKVANQIAAAQAALQAATKAAGPAANASYIGTALQDATGTTGTNLIAPDYRTPFSWQFNAGFERQLHQGTVLKVDYLRNVSLHYLLAYDTNHVGDARYLDKAAAMNAVNLTNESFGCPDGPGGVNCAIAAGASISDYAGNGLDSGIAYASGAPNCGCAFPGINPKVGTNQMLFPIGRSVYNALQVELRQNVERPLPLVRHLSLEASYSLSRFDGMATDQDFITNATDFANINHYFGPTSLDRTDQFSFGGVGTLPGGFRLALIVHAFTSLPQTLTVPPGPSTSVGAGQIFISDLTGDGTQGDVLPGTNIGSFDRQVNGGNINNYIDAYNKNDAGKPTPAGMALVNAGLFTASQLKQLGAVTPTLAMAPAGQVNMGGVFTSDLQLTYVFHLNKLWGRFGEEAVFEPSVSFFNLTNSANYNSAATLLITQLNAAGDTTPGAANSTTYKQQGPNRVLPGSGTFGFGSPRVLEFGAKFTF